MNKIDNYRNITFRAYPNAPRVASILNKTEKEINLLAGNAPEIKQNFLTMLSDRYIKNTANESEQKVLDIFDMIKKPTENHIEIIRSMKGSISYLQRVFQSIGNKNKRLDFAVEVNKLLKNNKESEVVAELLESPHSKEYVNNFETYKPYIYLNSSDKNLVKSLDEMLDNNSYDFQKYNKEYNIITIQKEFGLPDSQIFNSKVVVDNYSQTKYNFIKYFLKYLQLRPQEMENNADKIILNIYETANEQNVAIRERCIRRYIPSINFSNDKVQGLANMNKLYTQIDSNSYAKNFVNKLFNEKGIYLSVSELTDILDNVSHKKLDIFYDNAAKIISKTNPENRIEALNNNIENPFYATKSSLFKKKMDIRYGFQRKDTIFSKAREMFLNGFRILRDKLTKDTHTQEKIDLPKQNIVHDAEITQKKEIKPKKKVDKTEIINNIMSFINPKLGVKTLERQRDDFSKYATKMRFKMLPEIFASITDTRKVDRAAGKKHMRSANKDAVELFKLINGNNKKYVNYLLKIRNSENSRIFEVKDIINMIKQSEAKIAQEKKTNPEYRARDARRYYNYLFETEMQKYGKVKPSKRAKVAVAQK